ncbi:hypothetical protein ADUPG1_004552, partial [Aduncisulcus paluster]
MSLRPNVSLAVFMDGEIFFKSKKLPSDLEYDQFPKFGDTGNYPNEYLFNTYETTIQRQVDYVSDKGKEVTVFILYSVGSQASRLFIV